MDAKDKKLVLICVTVLICVCIVCYTAYSITTTQQNNTTDNNTTNTTNNTTTNNTGNNTTLNNSNNNSNSSNASTGTTTKKKSSTGKSSSSSDSDKYDTQSDTYLEHEDWEASQVDQAESKGYTVRIHQHNDGSHYGYAVYDKQGNYKYMIHK